MASELHEYWCAILGLNQSMRSRLETPWVAVSVYDDCRRSQQVNATGSASNQPHS